LESGEREYVKRAHVVADETFDAEAPFRVSLTPAHLVD
jgi:hypothetical protein